MWNNNTYPGCGCDIPSHMYSVSSDLNPNWTEFYSKQPEIKAYAKSVADRHNVSRHVRLGSQVLGMAWNEGTSEWTVTVRSVATGVESSITCRYVILASGGLHIPQFPTTLKGFGDFSGPAFHSSEWDHSADYAGKRVAIVGSAASAVQILPEVAKTASKVTVYQRTANWVVPRHQFRYPAWLKWLFQNVPGTMLLHRWTLFAVLDARIVGFTTKGGIFNRLLKLDCLSLLKKSVKDESVRRKLRPTITPGCKRVLVSDDFYATFNRPNVQLVTSPIEHIATGGIVSAEEGLVEADIVVYATGFKVQDMFSQVSIKGRAGHALPPAPSAGADSTGLEGYYGTLVHGFPNLFTIMGPNTGTGHMSVISFIECQLTLITKLMRGARETGAASVEVTAEAQEKFNKDIQEQFKGTVWTSGNCTSWYQDSTGRVLALWPTTATQFWWQTREPNWDHYVLKGAERRVSRPSTLKRALKLAIVLAFVYFMKRLLRR